KAIGVGLIENLAVGGGYAVFVDGEFRQVLDEKGPDAGIAGIHGVAVAVPAVEVADEGDIPGIGRPYGECRSFSAVGFKKVGAEFFVNAFMGPLVEQVLVEIGEPGRRQGMSCILA